MKCRWMSLAGHRTADRPPYVVSALDTCSFAAFILPHEPLLVAMALEYMFTNTLYHKVVEIIPKIFKSLCEKDLRSALAKRQI